MKNGETFTAEILQFDRTKSKRAKNPETITVETVRVERTNPPPRKTEPTQTVETIVLPEQNERDEGELVGSGDMIQHEQSPQLPPPSASSKKPPQPTVS